jgi:transcriptional regulator with XRE-family HTH domain
MPIKRPTAGGAAAEQHIGTALRRLRKDAGLSVRTLAKNMGFSASFISQLENGLVSPSIASLERIALTLGVTLVDLLATPSSTHVALVRAEARPNFTSAWSKARVDALTPLNSARTLEALMVTLDSEGSSGKRPAVADVDQFAMVLKGRLVLTHAHEEIRLVRGDTVLIRASTARRWQNSTRQPAQVLIVSSRGR